MNVPTLVTCEAEYIDCVLVHDAAVMSPTCLMLKDESADCNTVADVLNEGNASTTPLLDVSKNVTLPNRDHGNSNDLSPCRYRIKLVIVA